MKCLAAAIPILAATALLGAPAFAHHSLSMFDTTQEILIEGKVARFDWVNPHMYLIVETTGPDGKPALVEGEGVGITQALVDGLDRDALKPGTPVVMRANPNRGGWGSRSASWTSRRRTARFIRSMRRTPDARADAGREHRGSLGARAGCAGRGFRRHGALAGHAGRPCRSGTADRRWDLHVEPVPFSRCSTSCARSSSATTRS